MTGEGLRAAAALAALAALAGLALLVAKTLAGGRRAYLSPASGSASRGVAYAFGAGMLPWAKESAAHHLSTYAAGMLYHAGVFAALATFVLALSGAAFPAAMRIPAAALLAAGLAAGLVLAGRRALSARLRALSVPDDFVANVLTDMFIGGALLALLDPARGPLFLAAAIPFFLYLPLGKVRHCVFFFLSRTFLGAWYGRRGVFPPGH